MVTASLDIFVGVVHDVQKKREWLKKTEIRLPPEVWRLTGYPPHTHAHLPTPINRVRPCHVGVVHCTEVVECINVDVPGR